MHSPTRPVVLLLIALAWLPGPAFAESPAPAEPKVERTVIEDDGARIEELRVRGHVVHVRVQPKRAGARPYEILPPQQGRDPSQPAQASGQRVWNVLSF